jgi:hypothetical protein
MNTSAYQFTLVLKNVNSEGVAWADNLFDAGCDDALVNVKAGTVYLDFDRQAASLENAVMSAISDVESAGIGAAVISVAPEDWVTETEIAKRLHITRQTVSLWMQKKRRGGTFFPAPVMKLSGRSPLWKWREVVEWLHQNGIITAQEILHKAIFFETLNVALLIRQMTAYSLTQNVFTQLSTQLH